MHTYLTSLLRPSWLAALTASLTLAAAQATEVSTNQVFQVAPGGHLVIDADRGSIAVTTADTNAVGITVVREVKRADPQVTDEILAAHRLTFTQDGQTVTVRAKSPKDGSSWRKPSLSVRYLVTVPKQFNLKLSTGGGAISVDDIAGTIDLDTSGGSISVGQVDGVVKADTSGGSIKVAGATGDVNVDTSGGSIDLGKMGGAVQAETSGGSIRIKSASSAVHADTSGGSIDLGEMSGPVQAETSGGSITARFTQSPAGDSSLDTSGGHVTVYLADQAGFQLDAECSGGRVNSEVPVTITGKPSKTELRGPISGGGPGLKLRTSGGGISVKKLVAVK